LRVEAPRDLLEPNKQNGQKTLLAATGPSTLPQLPLQHT
jgi:hypothetical protein